MQPQPQINPQMPQNVYQQEVPIDINSPAMMPSFAPEMNIRNVVDQINPQQIIDNLDHALKGEFYNKETGTWEMNSSGKSLVNDSCRGAIISYVTGLLTNNTTMSIINENQLSHIMDSVIQTITRTFVVNLEEFGFVPPGPKYSTGVFENKGTPDSARMGQVANMVYSIVFLVLTRALKGMESRKIFSSLSMSDAMGFQPPPQQQGNWINRMFR